MEKIFIQKIYKLTEQIFQADYTYDAMLEELKTHLEKSRQMKSRPYEVEVLNTIGILYAIEEDIPNQLKYFQEALEQAYHTENEDLIIKTNNNTASTLISLWQLDEADKALKRAIDMIEKQNLRVIGAIYCYSNIVTISMIRGQFQSAQQYLDKGFAIAQNVDMKQYSRTEYVQILISLYQARAMLNMHSGNYSKVLDDLKLSGEQIKATGRDDMAQDNRRMYMLYALIGEQDNAKAATFEQDYIKYLVAFSPSTTLQTAIFLWHNDQLAWAKRYAQQVLDNTDDNDKTMILFREHAQSLLDRLSA